MLLHWIGTDLAAHLATTAGDECGRAHKWSGPAGIGLLAGAPGLASGEPSSA